MATPTGLLFYDPRAKPLSTYGAYQPGCYYLFYQTGTTTQANVYADGLLTTPLSQTPGANQPSCTADSSGRFNPIYMNPAQIYRVQLYTSLGVLLEDTDPYVPSLQITGATVGAALYPIMTAESNAGLTASNIAFQYQPLTLERYLGGVGASASVNNTALTNLFAVVKQNGGGVVQVPAPNAPNGTYQFTQASNYLPEYLVLQGAGQNCAWQYTGSGQFLLGASGVLTPFISGSRVTINDILIYGTNQSGIGITLGDSGGNCNRVHMNRVVMNGWGTALQINGTTWSSFYDCEFGSALGGTFASPVFSNNYGVAFNPINSNNYTSAVGFYNCTMSNNGLRGVSSNNTSLITANCVTWVNCNVQNNCAADPNVSTSPSTVYQFFMGLCNVFTIQGLYLEYKLGGVSAPCGVSVFGLGYGSIHDFYMDTVWDGITDAGGGSCAGIDIFHGEIVTPGGHAITITNDPDIMIRDVVGTPISISGSGSRYLPSGSGLASWPVDEAAFTPVFTSGGGSVGTITGVGLYSRMGNSVIGQGSVTWSGASPTGAITITGLPIVTKAGGPPGAVSLYFTGLTPAGSSQITGNIAAGGSTVALYQSGAASAALQGSAVAAAGNINFSFVYQV
jgi:hypothetical protein